MSPPVNTNRTRGVILIIAVTAATAAFGFGLHVSSAHYMRTLPQPGYASSVDATTHSLQLASSEPSVHTIAQEPSIGDTVGARSDDASDTPAATFQKVYLLLKQNYVEGIPNDSVLTHGTASAMIASLMDPNSRFMDSQEFAEVKAEANGTYAGSGATVSVQQLIHPKDAAADTPQYTELRLTVVDAMPNTSSAKAGLRTGDVITNFGGHWIATFNPVLTQTKQLKAVQQDPVAFNALAAKIQKQIDGAYSIAQVQTKLNAPISVPTQVTVDRSGIGTVQLTLEPAPETLLVPVETKKLPGDVEYAKIIQFTPETDADLTRLLIADGPSKKVILDLRGNVGGLIDSAQSVAATISNLTSIGNIETNGAKIAALPVQGHRATLTPIAVLINRGTANAAELLASALQAAGAKVYGERSFGDTVASRAIALRDGSGFTLTVGKLLTIKQQDFTGKGIAPDVTIPSTLPDDATLNTALAARA